DAGKLIGDEPKSLLQPGVWAAVIVAAVVLILIGYQIFHKTIAPEFEPASIEKMAFPLPDKPSIAVLPFDNMSSDPNQEFFSDGISEDIITALSKAEELFVIARNSTFTYKGKPVKIKQVAEELGVRYVLEGSVRKTEDRVRITAQLIDAVAGDHLWAERYDRELKDIFALQDEITMKIVTALEVKLTEGEQFHMSSGKGFKTLDVKLKAMEAYSLWKKGTIASHMRNGQLAQELIDMAPESGVGYTWLGRYYWYLAMHGQSPYESITKAFNLAQKALSLDEYNHFAYGLLSNLYTIMRQYDKAIAAGERSVALNPNGAENHCALGITLGFAGMQDEAIDHFKYAIRLDPFPQYYFFLHLGRCYMHKGQYEEALLQVKKALHISPESSYNNGELAMIYALLGRQEEAEEAVKKTLELDPSYSVERASKVLPYKNQADLKFILDALRKAGFPHDKR
ncbi:MAG: tetratricopeptide repeat protein, partial [Desulfobacterales bacterium]|nr:tetratricopeptide repeat protein [Desulfobacterales bacterium]